MSEKANNIEEISNQPNSDDFKKLQELGLDMTVNEKPYQITPDYIAYEKNKAHAQAQQTANNPGHSKSFATSELYKKVLEQKEVEASQPTRRPYLHQNDSSPMLEAGSGGGGNDIPASPPPTDDFAFDAGSMPGGPNTPGFDYNDPLLEMTYGEAGLPPQDNSPKARAFAGKTTAVWLSELIWEDLAPWAIYETAKSNLKPLRDKGLPNQKLAFQLQNQVDKHNRYLKANIYFDKKDVAEWRDTLTILLEQKGWNQSIPPTVQFGVATARLGWHGYQMIKTFREESNSLDSRITKALNDFKEDWAEEVRKEAEKIARTQAIKDSVKENPS
jgi:hypothetical protein